MATHSSVLAWRIPRTGEPGGLPSLGSHRVGHDCSDLAAAANLDVTTFLNRFLVSCQSQHNCSSSSCMCATLKIFLLENCYYFVFVSPKLRIKNKDPITMQGSSAGNPRLCDLELIA